MWKGLDGGGCVNAAWPDFCFQPPELPGVCRTSQPLFSVSVMLIMPESTCYSQPGWPPEDQAQILSLHGWSQRCWLQWWAVLQETTSKFYTHALVAMWGLGHICWSCLPWLYCKCWLGPCASRPHVPKSRWALSSCSPQILALVSFLLCWLLHSASDELLLWQLELFCWLAFPVWTWDTSFELPGSVVFQRVSGHQGADSAGASLQRHPVTALVKCQETGFPWWLFLPLPEVWLSPLFCPLKCYWKHSADFLIPSAPPSSERGTPQTEPDLSTM